MNRLVARALIVAGSVGAVAVAGIAYLGYGLLHPPLPPSLAQLGTTGLTDAQGGPIRLAQLVAPRSAAVVAFWATWCVPCRGEATALAALRRKYRAGELSIAYLNVDAQPDAAATAKFLRATHAENLPVVHADAAAWTAITGQQTMTLPRAYVFDRSGRAVATFAGTSKDGSMPDLDVIVTNAVR